MIEGLYEDVVTRDLTSRIENLLDLQVDLGAVDDADGPGVLGRHLTEAILRRLAAEKDPRQRLIVANRILAAVSPDDSPVGDPLRQLRAVRRPPGPGQAGRYRQRPRTPLNDHALLTNASGEPSLASELGGEIDSADGIDLLCAFVMWRGLRLLEKPLLDARGAGVPIRVVTTTYIGGTERIALDRLVRDFGAEVRVQYNAARTRLHAKAWLFRRNSGFDTAYVGSSNLSTSALLDGVEWNVRLSRAATGSLLQKFQATFDSYWDSGDFETYLPDVDTDRLDDALSAARGRGAAPLSIAISGLEVRPFPHQQEILDSLEVERAVHDRHRNLVVAATGTGKTVVAALDYRRLTGRPRLLFVAHRQEILEQSLRTYREVLSDANFGELYVAGKRPERWQHVFASIQALTSYGLTRIPREAFDVVVVDEFHHAQARTYRNLLEHVMPQELLGLTATPERADGSDVRSHFDGRTAAELRLWDALGADLLCPFHYFVVADGTDLRRLAWVGGGYRVDELSGVYTGNDARARIVLTELRDKVADIGSMRALGFCAGVDHAHYMARVFRDAGIPAQAVSGDTTGAERRQALDDLRNQRLKVLFAADLFNEGLDIPEVDTVLMLRPTESATLFLQQLGRGLRRTPEKAVLTVLDFVGEARREFRWDQRLRALTGDTRAGIIRQTEQGFGFLPSGCQIMMDRESQQSILHNLRSQIAHGRSRIVGELRSLGDPGLSEFLGGAGLELSDILRGGDWSWTQLRRAAGLPTAGGSEQEEKLLRRIRAFAHVDDRVRAATYLDLLADDAPTHEELTPIQQRLAQMLVWSLWSDGGGHASVAEALASLRPEVATRRELATVVDISFAASPHVALDLTGPLEGNPLRVHARYQREEILAGLGSAQLPRSFQQGVWYSSDLNVDAFFVTLTKSEADYSPTTMYRDYPISPTLFHWESQSATSVTSATGRRYLDGSSTVLIFARQQRRDEFGTSPYLFLGPATYVSHTGDRPIGITWRLQHAMPMDFFTAGSAVAK